MLKTIGSVGNVISGLGIDDTNVAGFFNSLKDGLNAPLQGMSIAFSSSLLGLAGSLILGFIDINLGQAQNKFSLFFEKVVNNNSAPDLLSSTSSDNVNSQALQKIYAKELQLYGVPGWMYYSFARSFLLLNDYKKSSKYALSAMIKHKSTYIKLKAFATWLEAKYKQLIT